MSGIDYYRILGVPASATGRAIREAYLGKVRSLHPDRVGPEGTALFQQITEAYENLSDPVKRRAYDSVRRSAERPRYPEPEGVGFDVVAEPLTHQSQTERVEFRITLTGHEALRGVVLPLATPVVHACPWCSGRGGMVPHCPGCGGSGGVIGERAFHIRIPPGVRDGSVIDVTLGRKPENDIRFRFHVRVQSGFWVPTL